MTTASRLAARFGALAILAAPAVAHAQGNLSGYGLGYPEGQLSTAALATGGGQAEFDVLSPINPSALAGAHTLMIHVQYDPEFRTVTADGTSEQSTTIRFPLLAVVAPIGARFSIGASASSFLDRTWMTSTTGPVAVGDTTVQSTATFKSDGGIVDLQVGGGWQATSWLRVGLALHEFTGEDRITIMRTFADTDTVKTVPFDQYTDFSINGYGASVGLEVQPSPVIGIAASYRAGGTLRGHLGDTLQDKASVPPRAGGGVRLNAIPGLTISANADWEGWSRLNGFGPSIDARDALELGGGVDLSGPRVSGDRPLIIRAGVRERDLPFLVNGAVVNETDVSSGVGIPLAGPHATMDITLQHSNRTAPVGVGETAWTLSLGLTVRP